MPKLPFVKKLFVAALASGIVLGAAELALDPVRPGFSKGFPSEEEIDALYRDVYLDAHRRFVDAQPPMRELL